MKEKKLLEKDKEMLDKNLKKAYASNHDLQWDVKLMTLEKETESKYKALEKETESKLKGLQKELDKRSRTTDELEKKLSTYTTSDQDRKLRAIELKAQAVVNASQVQLRKEEIRAHTKLETQEKEIQGKKTRLSSLLGN
jgi:septation ring formation regulator EzrA